MLKVRARGIWNGADGSLARVHPTAPVPSPLLTALVEVCTRLLCDAQLEVRLAGGLAARFDTVSSRYADRIRRTSFATLMAGTTIPENWATTPAVLALLAQMSEGELLTLTLTLNSPPRSSSSVSTSLTLT